MTTKPPAEPDHSGRTMRTSVTIAATPKAAWEAWADPERIAHWFVDRASGTATAGGTMTWFFNRFKYALPYEMVLQDGGRRTGRQRCRRRRLTRKLGV